MLWEHKYLETRARDLEEHYTDLHMLRVTKNLQEFIKGGDMGDRQKEVLDKAEGMLAHMRRAHESKVRKHKGVLRKLQQQVEDKMHENGRLAEQVEDTDDADDLQLAGIRHGVPRGVALAA